MAPKSARISKKTTKKCRKKEVENRWNLKIFYVFVLIVEEIKWPLPKERHTARQKHTKKSFENHSKNRLKKSEIAETIYFFIRFLLFVLNTFLTFFWYFLSFFWRFFDPLGALLRSVSGTFLSHFCALRRACHERCASYLAWSLSLAHAISWDFLPVFLTFLCSFFIVVFS